MIVIDMTATGMNIKSIREAKGYTVKDIQEAFGFASVNAIYKWQKGESLPSIDNLLALSIMFDVTMEDILVTADK